MNKHRLRTLPLLLAAALAALPALADMDHAAEARRQAARDAEARRAAAAQRENQRIKAEFEAKGRQQERAEKRKYLGPAADGKSDAELDRMMQERIHAHQAQATAKAREIRQGLATPQGAAATRQVTGHSMQEMMQMNDAQLEALSREMERKYKR